MAVGSHCLFTATVALTEPIAEFPVFEDFDPTWAETRDPDNVYSVVSGNIRVAEAGRYLVTVGLHNVDMTISRLAIHTICRKNTTVIEKSFAVGNARHEPNPEIFTKSEFMIDLAANDDIDIQWAKKDIGIATLAPATTYIQLVRLTDDTNTAYALYSDGTDIASYDSATPVPAPFDIIDEETNTSVIQRHVTNNDEFLLKGSIGDRFLVLASVYFHDDVLLRVTRDLNATLDGIQINGVSSYFFVRNQNTSDGSVNASFIVTKKLNSDETLRITLANPEITNLTLVRAINRSGLHIMKLLPTTEIAMFHDATGGEAIEGVTQLLSVWRDEDERDAASFVQTDANTLTIQKTGTYICGSNVYGSRVVDNTRSNYMGEFIVNGATVIEGNHGCYSRLVSRVGFNLLGILEISAAQTLEVQTRVVGQNGNDTGTLANRTGAWAINADTLVFVPLIKTVDEAVNISEDELSLLPIIKQISEIMDIAEQQNIILNLNVILDEVENISESILVLRNIVRHVDEILNLGENTQSGLSLSKVINEIENIEEGVIVSTNMLSVISNETVNIVESIATAAVIIKIINEEESILDIPTLSRGTVRQATAESVSISESDLVVRVFSKQADEEINIMENASIFQFIPRFFLTFRSRILKGDP